MPLVLSLGKANTGSPDREPVWLFGDDFAMCVVSSEGGRKLVFTEHDYVEGTGPSGTGTIGDRRGKDNSNVAIMRQSVRDKKRQNVGQS